MDLTARQEKILSLLRSDGRVDVENLADQFTVTSQTIRRDLGELCDLGLAVRTHGGAKRIAAVANREYQDRQRLQAPEKEAMGALAASLIPNECSITLNIGTSTEQVARALVGHRGLMVLSNNINVWILKADDILKFVTTVKIFQSNISILLANKQKVEFIFKAIIAEWTVSVCISISVSFIDSKIVYSKSKPN